MILESLYFMLPAYFANMAPILFKHHWKSLAIPMDHDMRFCGEPLLGTHKTWRGFFSAIVVGGLVFLLQKQLGIQSIIEYETAPVYLGFLMGLGAIGGDIVKSFIKRRAHISEGKSFPVFDQLDFVIGALLISRVIVSISLSAIVIIVIISPLLTILINHLAYCLKLRTEAW